MTAPHVQRMVDELSELSNRVNKLCDFLSSNTFVGLTPVDQGLLRVQLAAMRSYETTLSLRLKFAQPVHELRPPIGG